MTLLLKQQALSVDGLKLIELLTNATDLSKFCSTKDNNSRHEFKQLLFYFLTKKTKKKKQLLYCSDN